VDIQVKCGGGENIGGKRKIQKGTSSQGKTFKWGNSVFKEGGQFRSCLDLGGRAWGGGASGHGRGTSESSPISRGGVPIGRGKKRRGRNEVRGKHRKGKQKGKDPPGGGGNIPSSMKRDSIGRGIMEDVSKRGLVGKEIRVFRSSNPVRRRSPQKEGALQEGSRSPLRSKNGSRGSGAGVQGRRGQRPAGKKKSRNARKKLGRQTEKSTVLLKTGTPSNPKILPERGGGSRSWRPPSLEERREVVE